MNVLYVDYTHAIENKTGKVHGGGNYIRTFLMDLISSGVLETSGKRVVILWPSEHMELSEIEKEIYDHPGFEIQKIRGNISDFEFEKDSCVFLPLLGVKEYPLIKTLKEKGLSVAITVHGVRNLDLKKDRYNYAYEKGMENKAVCFAKEMLIPVKKAAYKSYIRKYLPCADLVITVSNYTLSRLSEIADLNNVILQYEKILPVKTKIKRDDKPYMFFVSGNRREKNLARTIDAYKEYISRGGQYALYVVGAAQKVREALTDNLGIKKLVDEGKIVFFDYVSDEELVSLYLGAKFLMYTSKSEGFGLPALEAATYEIPTVAAYGTSIPEVIGDAAIYVNPYLGSSIAEGMLRMSDEKTAASFRERLKKRVEISQYLAEKSSETIRSYFFD